MELCKNFATSHDTNQTTTARSISFLFHKNCGNGLIKCKNDISKRKVPLKRIREENERAQHNGKTL